MLLANDVPFFKKIIPEQITVECVVVEHLKQLVPLLLFVAQKFCFFVFSFVLSEPFDILDFPIA